MRSGAGRADETNLEAAVMDKGKTIEGGLKRDMLEECGQHELN